MKTLAFTNAQFQTDWRCTRRELRQDRFYDGRVLNFDDNFVGNRIFGPISTGAQSSSAFRRREGPADKPLSRRIPLCPLPPIPLQTAQFGAIRPAQYRARSCERKQPGNSPYVDEYGPFTCLWLGTGRGQYLEPHAVHRRKHRRTERHSGHWCGCL
jgi:hypothetical protein